MQTETNEDFILGMAQSILLSRMRKLGGVIENTQAVRQYLVTEYALLQEEQFGCMFLDRGYKLINHKTMFRGTIGHCTTYPREIAREALLQNAVFVILVHNHPSLSLEPSEEDVSMTNVIKTVLEVLDITLFDHIIVAGDNIYSMRGEGILD